MTTRSASDSVLEGLGGVLADAEALYKDVHSHPELSMQEERTAGIAAEQLSAVGAALPARFGEDRVAAIPPVSASEDFGSFGTEWQVPSVFWTIGGTDPDLYARAEREGRLTELPTNHNPRFAPVLHPTLETGIEALVAGACAWLSA